MVMLGYCLAYTQYFAGFRLSHVHNYYAYNKGGAYWQTYIESKLLIKNITSMHVEIAYLQAGQNLLTRKFLLE